jgi:hypothetical protein
MQSIFGALLTAGYAAAAAAAVDAAPRSVSDSVESELTKSFSSASATAERYPQYASSITAGAKQAFLEGDHWAYLAGIVAILLGATIVYFLFPRREDEQRLLAEYHTQDAAG